jgi:hypothetical protein
MSHQQRPPQLQQQSLPRPMPSNPPSRRSRIPAATGPLIRRPGPHSRIATTPPGPQSGRLRDVSLASLLEGVDQVPSARKRLIPTPAGVIATGASRPGVMQAKVPQR